MIDCKYGSYVIYIKKKHDPDILALSLDFQCDGWLVSCLSISWQEFELQNLGKTWQISLSAKSLFRRKRSYIRILVHTYMVIHGWDCKDEPKPIQYDDPTVKFSLLLWIYSFHGFTEDSAKKETSLKFHRVVK